MKRRPGFAGRRFKHVGVYRLEYSSSKISLADLSVTQCWK